MPDVRYPELTTDVVKAYIWILYFLQQVLGVNPQRIVVGGDSAGGTLALMLTTWCIENGVRVPDYLHLHYPVTDLSTSRCTPSNMYELVDTMIHFNGIFQSRVEYCAGLADPESDYLLSPVLTPLHLLKRFPPTDIFTTENDTLCDESWRMGHKLV